jgi:hypothetical protein
MPLMQRGVAAFSDHLPKVVSPTTHAIADYANLGGFALMAALFWKRNHRAAIASMICGFSEALNTMLTDFPGGVANLISFQTHGKIDMGLAATCSALPDFMGFADEPESKYFRMMGINITVVGALTDFSARDTRKSVRRRVA